MTERHNPLGRFTGLAKIYAQCRPSYPPAAVNLLVERCRLGPQSLLVDVGCGTGISSRLFADLGVPVLGIEPNAEMRAAAEAEPGALHSHRPVYRDGQAENTGLPDAMAGVILAAQAFHWFQPDRTLAEFHRILKPEGWVALMWNERDAADPFTAAYGEVIRSTPDAAAIEMPRGKAGEPLLHSPLFQGAQRMTFKNSQALDEEGLLGRAFSASYAPREREAAQAFATGLSRAFKRFQQEGQVTLCYETSLYLAQKPLMKEVPGPEGL